MAQMFLLLGVLSNPLLSQRQVFNDKLSLVRVFAHCQDQRLEFRAMNSDEAYNVMVPKNQVYNSQTSTL